MNTEKNKSNFQFQEPRLVESIFIENPNYKGKFQEINTLNLGLRYSISAPKKVNKNNDMESMAQLTVMSSEKMNLDDNTPCYLRVTMRAKFKWNSKDFSEETAKQLMQVNAPSLLLSYIRPNVVNLTENSDIPTQHIPFVNFVNK